MCYQTRLIKKREEILEEFNIAIDELNDYQPFELCNAFDFPKTPVITSENPNRIQNFNWGLIPEWATDESIKKYTLNAKIETLNEKPSFKNNVNNRCLIIADGFYEWQWLDSKGKSKQKYELTLPNDALFAFAGLWSTWKDELTNELKYTYTIVTTEANEMMSKIHNTKKRMPIILLNSNQKDWLSNASLESFKKIDLPLRAKKIGLSGANSSQLKMF